MPSVNLKRQWFDPEGNLRTPTTNPQKVPDGWKLPSTAEVLPEVASDEPELELPTEVKKPVAAKK